MDFNFIIKKHISKPKLIFRRHIRQIVAYGMLQIDVKLDDYLI